MNDHIKKKFPDQIKAIQAMLQNDATFREICGEYEEMCTWLACQDRAGPRPSKEYDDAYELMQNLEDEIQKALKEAGF